jgi:hypothetical protein
MTDTVANSLRGMPIRLRRGRPDHRRPVRATAFRSTEMGETLRAEMEPVLTGLGFRRLGKRAWVKPAGASSLIVKLQARQSGWDRCAGSLFIVEFELSDSPKLDSGWHRQRLWRLLAETDRSAFHRLNNQVAATLPPPDPHFVAALPPQAAEWYQKAFEPSPMPQPTDDVWFRYYDQDDVTAWGRLIAPTLAAALQTFESQEPSLFGHRSGPDTK